MAESAAESTRRADPTFHAPVDVRLDESPAAPNRPRSAHGPLLVFSLICLLATTALLFYVWQRAHAPAARLADAPVQAPAATATAPAAEPAIAHPIEDAQRAAAAAADDSPLPALADSDTLMQTALATLFGGDALGRVFRSDKLVHRFVATIDDLSRKPVSLRLSPLNPAAGGFVASGRGDTLVLSASNAPRYAPFVRLVDAVDSPRLVAAYVHAYPLFQQAYRDLGYPKGYFNDRLIATIDDLLATPRVEGPVALVQPKVLYEFADPDLESRSAGQKMMLRLGPENAARVKGKLREIRHALTGKYPQG